MARRGSGAARAGRAAEQDQRANDEDGNDERPAVGATVVAPTRLATLAVLDARGDELDLERGADKRGNFV